MKNYEFQFNFPDWGNCDVVMTCVSGHLTGQEFDSRYRAWKSCSPSQLFEAEIVETIKPVSLCVIYRCTRFNVQRTWFRLPTTSSSRLDMPKFSISGPIAIERESISVLRFVRRQRRAMQEFWSKGPSSATQNGVMC